MKRKSVDIVSIIIVAFFVFGMTITARVAISRGVRQSKGYTDANFDTLKETLFACVTDLKSQVDSLRNAGSDVANDVFDINESMRKLALALDSGEEYAIENRERISALVPRRFNLAVLDSCGVITDGYGHGSAVAIAPDLVLTAGHCIGYPDSKIIVQGVAYPILEEWADSVYDIGIVRVDGNLPPCEFGDMPALLDEVYLVGSPYDVLLANTITRGIISNLDRDIYGREDQIQTDAEGAPGSSGCPLFDVDGRILGICVAGPQPGGGVSLCVSVDDIKAALTEYKNAVASR